MLGAIGPLELFALAPRKRQGEGSAVPASVAQLSATPALMHLLPVPENGEQNGTHAGC